MKQILIYVIMILIGILLYIIYNKNKKKEKFNVSSQGNQLVLVNTSNPTNSISDNSKLGDCVCFNPLMFFDMCQDQKGDSEASKYCTNNNNKGEEACLNILGSPVGLINHDKMPFCKWIPSSPSSNFRQKILNDFNYIIGQSKGDYSNTPAITGCLVSCYFCLWYSFTAGLSDHDLLDWDIWHTNLNSNNPIKSGLYGFSIIAYITRYIQGAIDDGAGISIGFLPSIAPGILLFLNAILKGAIQVYFSAKNTAGLIIETSGTIFLNKIAYIRGDILLISLYELFINNPNIEQIVMSKTFDGLGLSSTGIISIFNSIDKAFLHYTNKRIDSSLISHILRYYNIWQYIPSRALSKMLDNSEYFSITEANLNEFFPYNIQDATRILHEQFNYEYQDITSKLTVENNNKDIDPNWRELAIQLALQASKQADILDPEYIESTISENLHQFVLGLAEITLNTIIGDGQLIVKRPEI